ncbi:1-acyl-sn-glycerol-3-phosphate acyltransferase alpha-like [Pectinophora gossypiella]|uniref:1-acyl-sn-glycerol-3-phosphate acyltransferase alpha-like n=1 Tax=Pectinophora gossypiella TaxID=13191 RepID=UPI00214F0404|nr:1-acyl-sn-glycerol-3-phosphate acyltransferase alpha-like [Pectinophora gossypiella]
MMWDKIIYIFMIIITTYIVKQLFSETPNFIKFKSKFLVFYIWTSLTALILLPFFVFNPKNVKNSLFASQIVKHVTKIIEVKWSLRNGKYLAEDRGAVVVSNHQSSIDILGMFNIWHVADKVAAIARKEIFYVWPFGLAAYLAGVVFIDRNNSKDAYKQLKVTSEVMIKNKTKIWLFPEGTRNKDFTKLLPFKKGAFNIAVAAQVPIIPVVFSPYYFINRNKYIFNKGHAIIQCLEPIPTEGLTMDDVPALIERVRGIMDAAYKELSKEVLSALPNNYPLCTTD